MQQRKRAKHTRSKQGCATCRIRHVRCDQTRPFCKACTRSGRACEGYRQADEATRVRTPPLKVIAPMPSTGIPIARQLTARWTTDTNVDLVHFFLTHTASELAGDFQDDFWTTLVPQLGQREPCICHAISALAALHGLHSQGQPTHGKSKEMSFSIDLKQEAMNEYTRAVQSLNEHITSKGWSDLHVTFVCSVLCISFEWLRGDHDSALLHLRSSLSILNRWTNYLQPGEAKATTSPSSPAGHLIRHSIRSILTRFALQSAAFRNDQFLPIPAGGTSPAGAGGSSSTLHDARTALYDSIARALLQAMGPPEAEEAQNKPLWDATRLEQQTADTASEINLAIWRRAAQIIISTVKSEDEHVYDAFGDDFRDVVALARSLSVLTTSTFSVDMALVPVLYFVAIKCRDEETRREAIEILRSSPRREGCWDSIGTANLAEHVVELEAGEGRGPAPRRVGKVRVNLVPGTRYLWLRYQWDRQAAWSMPSMISW